LVILFDVGLLVDLIDVVLLVPLFDVRLLVPQLARLEEPAPDRREIVPGAVGSPTHPLIRDEGLMPS